MTTYETAILMQSPHGKAVNIPESLENYANELPSPHTLDSELVLWSQLWVTNGMNTERY